MSSRNDTQDVDSLRSDLYALLANLLAAPPDDAALRVLAGLSGDDTELGQRIGVLARLARQLDARAVKREYDALFIGVTRGELLPYASYYLTGFLNEAPLADLRGDMARLGIEKSKDQSEPEDHIATLCEIMAGLIRGTFGTPATLDEQRAFFEAHIARWAPYFFADLEAAKNSVFYAPVGSIGKIFMEVEEQAFRM